MDSSNSEKLTKIQQELDDMYFEFAKKDFEVKLAHHKKVQKILAERDALFLEMPEAEMKSSIQKAISNFEPIRDLLPQDSKGSCDSSFVKFIKAEFLDDYKMKVTVELHKNKYVENTILEKTMYLFEKDPEGVEVKWKDEQGACQLFDFFEADDDDLESFDIFYEFYLNLAFYSTAEE